MRIASIALAFTLGLVITNHLRAAEVAWSAADRAEIAKRAKKADKFNDGVRVRAASWTVATPFTPEFTAELSLWLDRVAELHSAVCPGKPQVTQATEVTVFSDRAKFTAAGGEANRSASISTNVDFSKSGKGSLSTEAVVAFMDPSHGPSMADAIASDLGPVIASILGKRLTGNSDYPTWMTGAATFIAFADWSRTVPENVDRIVAQLRPDQTHALNDAGDVAAVRGMIEVRSKSTSLDAARAPGFVAFAIRDRVGRKFAGESLDCSRKTKKFEPTDAELKAVAKAWFEFTNAAVAPK